MKTKPKLLHGLIAAVVLVPAVAWANLAVTTRGVNMRAGPDVSYPKVAFLSPGVTVNVVGCVEGYQWCDVLAGPNRGWVYGGYISARYNNAPTVIAYGGPTIGIPLVSFSIGPYWDSYYRGRPWWNNRAYWYDRYDHHYAGRPPQRYVETPRYNDHYNGHDNRQWQGNNRPEYHGNNGNRGRGNASNDRQAGSIPGPYTRAEGGSRDVIQGHRPNDQSNPNAQQ